MAPKKPRPRTARRERERAARDLVRQRQRLALLDPGASANRPIDVDSSSVIEGRARSHPCPLCAGRFDIDDHQAPGPSLRVLTITCRLCGIGRELWFRIGPPPAN